jgi:lipoprotein-releasing system permease protein
MQIRATAESGAGHICVVPQGWVATREDSLRLADWKGAEAAIRKLDGVRSSAARARITGLLAFGNRNAGVEIAGVVPEEEERSNRIVFKSKLEGRYLKTGDSGKIVIGRALAKRLDVEVGDDLHVTVAARDEIASAMLTIVGILDSGSQDLDLSICQVPLADLARISGYSGPTQIAILLEDYRLLSERRDELAAMLPEDEVVTWREMNPEIATNAEGDEAFMNGLAVIIIIVVALGIAGAQLTAVFERRMEFAILSALGMKGRQLVGLIMLEAVMVGCGGAVAALALGGPAALILSRKGIDFSALMGGELAFADVLFDPYLYGDFGSWIFIYAFGVCLASTVFASIYPAIVAARSAPAEALRRI